MIKNVIIVLLITGVAILGGLWIHGDFKHQEFTADEQSYIKMGQQYGASYLVYKPGTDGQKGDVFLSGILDATTTARATQDGVGYIIDIKNMSKIPVGK